jgi:hypothetical protein
MNIEPQSRSRYRPPPSTEAELRSLRTWHRGPWRDRHERWDLLPVSCLGLDRADWGPLFRAGLYTAGHLADALDQRRPPAILKNARLRSIAKQAIAEVRRQVVEEVTAMEREVAEDVVDDDAPLGHPVSEMAAQDQCSASARSQARTRTLPYASPLADLILESHRVRTRLGIRRKGVTS